MLRRKRIILSFAVFVAAYGLLVVPWPGLRDAFARQFRAAANEAFSEFSTTGRARFRPSTVDPMFESEALIGNTATLATATVPLSAHYIAFMPIAVMLALLAAAPFSLGQRPWALLLCLAGVLGFVWWRVDLLLRLGFANPAVGVLQPGPLSLRALYVANAALVEAPASYVVGPLLIWLVFVFRRRDWVLPAARLGAAAEERATGAP